MTHEPDSGTPAASYPAEPWHLHGHAYVGVWLVPRRHAPAPHSPGTRTVTVLGRAIVSAAFFVYEEPSPLTYHEIMSTLLVRQGWRVRVSITHIWVDSEASRDGGRALWAIPKELADFDVAPHASYAAADIGSLAVTSERRLPFGLPAAYQLAQDRDGELVLSPVASVVRLGLAKARWSFPVEGPIGFLSGRRPLLTLSFRPFRLIFGTR